MDEEAIIKWVYDTCILFGSAKSTALKVAAVFATGFETGQLEIKANNDKLTLI